MNRTTFFAALRARDNGLFGTNLSQRQVDGIEALLDAGRGLPLHHMANVLAQVYRETGGGMYPVKETVFRSHKDQNPSDAVVIARLDRAFAEGKLRGVRAPYWREGWFGRGQIQITHEVNYRRFRVTKEQALELRHSARIAVVGMRDGMFTGKRLADYTFPADLDAPPARNPRRIVNGNDGSDAEVARAHRAFAGALTAGGWAVAPAQRPDSPPQAVTTAPAPAPAPKPDGLLARILRALASLFSKR
jgi:hypothetical protein